MTPRPIAGVSVGDLVPAQTFAVTRSDLVRYAGASGDLNVIHWNERVAREVGLPNVIAHGMLSMALAGRVATDWAGDPGAVVDFGVRFTRPVVVPGRRGRGHARGRGHRLRRRPRRADGPHRSRGDLRGRQGDGPRPRHRPPGLTRRLRGVRLAELTTFRLGGPAARFVEATSQAELVAAVLAADSAGEPLLVLGGGSNVLVADAGFPGTVVLVRTRGIRSESDSCGGAEVEVEAGEPWDDVVRRAIEEEWSGIEALSGIPGSTGATPLQNVGAYGQEVAESVARVRVLDRADGEVHTWAAADCGFGYRTSRFRHDPRYVVLSVTFQLRLGHLGAPVRYAELGRRLAIDPGGRAPAADVRAAVLELRRSKGMLLDPGDHDTWSAGSFFLNPLLPVAAADALPADAPRFAQPDGRVKTSAAWLVEHAGFERGSGSGQARLSTKHTLALTNRGGASTAEVLELARTIRADVQERFGVLLEPEPQLVGCTL